MQCETSMFARVGGPNEPTLTVRCWQRISQLSRGQTDTHTHTPEHNYALQRKLDEFEEEWNAGADERAAMWRANEKVISVYVHLSA